jgi:molybdenum cofactor cytidylyltransferase
MSEDKNKTTAIILAAGQSKRMGSTNKLLANWRGKTPLEYVCQAALGSNCEATIVVTGHQREQVTQALKGADVEIIYNPDFASGMASSIKTGVSRASQSGSGAIIVLLGDMPGITSRMIDKIIEAGNASEPEAIIVATCGNKKGNPLLWKSSYFNQLLELEGDQGARQIITKYKDKTVELELGVAARFDLDTPEAFDRNIE